MPSRNLMAAASLAVLALTVSACGGGGVGSTPTPTPSPTPTPTPPPTGANADLLGPLKSETFVNDTTTASGTFPSSSNLNAGTATLNFSYNQSNGTYTVQVADRTQSFAAGNKDATQSNTTITTYKKVNGSTTDLLTLTNPGTSGALLYKYVGAGFWQRTVQSATDVQGTFDSFTYGVATPNSAVPRSGAASYDFDILGVLARASGSAPYALGGSGNLNIDFSVGVVAGNGTAQLSDTLNGAVIEGNAFTINGSVGSTNGITGTFVYDPTGAQYVGPLVGRFYGPAAEELGAAIYAKPQNQAFPGALTAAIVGRKSTGGSGVNLSLLNLVADKTFFTKGARVVTHIDQATGTLQQISTEDPSQFGGGGSRGPDVAYSAATKTYVLSFDDFGSFAGGSYGPAQLAASQPDARFTEYRTGSGTSATSLRLFKAGTGNPELVLTYASFGIWDRAQPPVTPGQDYQRRGYFTYGIASTAYPRTGSAAYSGNIYGTAGSTVPNTALYDLGGTFNFNFDFALDKFTGTFNPTGKDLLTGAQTNFGTYTLVNTRGPQTTGEGFDGYLMNNSNDVTGAIKGMFFGPQVNEVAGTWVIGEPITTNPGQFLRLTGVFVGKKN